MTTWHGARPSIAMLVAVALLIAVPTSTRAAEDEVRIGEFGSLAGSDAMFAQDVKDGVDMAVGEATQAGGVAVAGAKARKKVRVIVYDDQGKPEEALAVVRKLVTRDAVHVVIGEVTSALTLAAAPACQQQKVPLVSPSATAEKVTDVGPFVFRACFTDAFQAGAMAGFARKTLKARTAGILVDSGSDESVALGRQFADQFRKAGGQVALEQSFGKNDTDFKTQLLGFKEKNPDVLYVPASHAHAGQIAQQARDQGLVSVLLGSDSWDSPKLLEIGGPAIEGAYFTGHFDIKSARPEVKRFATAFLKRFHKRPTALAALGYDTARMVLDAIGRSRSLKGDDIRAALAATRDFPGVTGVITLDARRNPHKPAIIMKVGREEFEPAETVPPTP